MGRGLWVLLHRWVGLAMAGFLVLAGLTGSLIAFQAELDAWLNPDLFQARTAGEALSLDDLAHAVEAADPRVAASFIVPPAEPGRTALVTVSARADAGAGAPAPVGYNQVFVDPVSGAILGTREYGAWRFDSAHLMPFIVLLHYSLHLPGKWGDWLLGIVAIAWLLDSFVGFWLTLPAQRGTVRAGPSWWRRWKPAWWVKGGAGALRLNLDLHRAGGLWLWGLLLVLALTSIAMNLRREVFQPMVQLFVPVSPDPFRSLPERPLADGAARLRWHDAVQAARAHLPVPSRTWPLHGVYHAKELDAFAVTFVEPGNRNTVGRLGEERVFVHAGTGALLLRHGYGDGTAGDKYLAWQYPLHSGQIAGLPGRILVCAAGLAVAGLSITGVVIWASKRRARRFGRQLVQAQQAGA